MTMPRLKMRTKTSRATTNATQLRLSVNTFIEYRGDY